MQELIDFDNDLTELWCPACHDDRYFKPHSDFDCYVCVVCNFSVGIEFRDESNTYIDEQGNYILPPH